MFRKGHYTSQSSSGADVSDHLLSKNALIFFQKLLIMLILSILFILVTERKLLRSPSCSLEQFWCKLLNYVKSKQQNRELQKDIVGDFTGIFCLPSGKMPKLP